jgi:guanine deaminase
MLESKFILLITFVLFGAFAQYQAGTDVRKIETKERNLTTFKASINDSDNGFMRRAIALSRLALESDHNHPFGSVVVKDGMIIGEGWNKTELLKDPSAHAEMEAIRNASKTVSSTTLTNSVIYTSTQPCQMCLMLMYLSGIEKVYYCIPGEMIRDRNLTSSNDPMYNLLDLPRSEVSIPQVPMLEEEIDDLLKSYRRQGVAPL